MKYYDKSEKKGMNPLILILLLILIVGGGIAAIVWALLGSGEKKPKDPTEVASFSTEAEENTTSAETVTEAEETTTEAEESTTEAEESTTEAETTTETAVTTTEAQTEGYTGDGVAIDEKNFPDKEFRYLVQKRYDTNGDGGLDEEEIQAATVLSMPGRYVYDVTGIEYLTALQEIDCSETFISAIDLSKNEALRALKCGGTRLTELDLSGHSALISVDCSLSELERLDVSGCAALEEVICSVSFISQLDLSGCVSLKRLDCSCAALTSLDLTMNTALEELSCFENPLGKLDLSHNTELQKLVCSYCGLSALDLRRNTKLQWLDLGTYIDYYTHSTDAQIENRNKVSQLDVSMLPELIYLDCNGISLKNLDLRNNAELEELYCAECGLKELNLGQMTSLDTLECSRNDLGTLVIDGCPRLNRLWCVGAKLTALDVSACPQLAYLECQDNALTTLDLRHNTNLDPMYLHCDPGVTIIDKETEPSEAETHEEETLPPETVYGEKVVVLETIPGKLDDMTNILRLNNDTYHWQAEESSYHVWENRRAEIEEDYLVLYGTFSLTIYPEPGRAWKKVVYLDREVTKLPLAQQVEYKHNGFASDAEAINAALCDDYDQKILYFTVVDGVITDIGSIIR